MLPRPPVPDSPECRWQARIGLHPLLRAVRATSPPIRWKHKEHRVRQQLFERLARDIVEKQDPFAHVLSQSNRTLVSSLSYAPRSIDHSSSRAKIVRETARTDSAPAPRPNLFGISALAQQRPVGDINGLCSEALPVVRLKRAGHNHGALRQANRGPLTKPKHPGRETVPLPAPPIKALYGDDCFLAGQTRQKRKQRRTERVIMSRLRSQDLRPSFCFHAVRIYPGVPPRRTR